MYYGRHSEIAHHNLHSTTNRVVERRNCTIIQMERCVLENKFVSYQYWVEAVHTSVYILSQSLTNVVHMKTPKEAWFERKPRTSYLKTFGLVAYSWIREKK